MTIALTRLTLGFHVLFVRLCEWETLIPKVTPFPQISHFAIRLHLLINLSFKLSNVTIISYHSEKCKPFLKKTQNFFEKPKFLLFYLKKSSVCSIIKYEYLYIQFRKGFLWI